jgi:multidrug efflux pump
MSISEFFIRRPVFATVLNVMLVVIGILAYQHVTVREFPDVTMPVIKLVTRYPNASAELVEQNLTTELEDGLAGIEGMDTIYSVSKQNVSEVTISFRSGVTLQEAQARVRDRLIKVTPQLPKEAKNPTFERDHNSDFPFLFMTLTSNNASMAEMTHYTHLYLKNVFRAIPGVSAVMVWGQKYVMKIKLDPIQMYAHGLGASDVLDVIREYNKGLPAGKFRDEVPMTLEMRPETPVEFEELVVREAKGSVVLLKDVADVEMVGDDSERMRLNGKAGVIIGVVKSSEGNPLKISKEVNELLIQLRNHLPKGYNLVVARDEADFIRDSLSNIKKAIFEAAVLVIIIIFLFLRNLRSTIIPIIAIPVSLISTLFIVYIFGFSINTITLLALMLSIGIVVDDAIVVLENIHRHIENGMKPFAAAIEGSKELVFAILAMTFTLASVYAPIAFVEGAIGKIFIEFAVTLAGAVILSGVVALTLSPMLCSRWLKPHQEEYFPRIERVLKLVETRYQYYLGRTLNKKAAMLWVVLGMAIVCVALFKFLPQQVVPREDRGFLGIFVEPIPGIKVDAFDEMVKGVEDLVKPIPERDTTITFVSNDMGNVIIPLKDFSDRKRSVYEILGQLRQQVKEIPSLTCWPWTMETGLPGLERRSFNDNDVMVGIQTIGSYQDLRHELDHLKTAIEAGGFFDRGNMDLYLNAPGFTAKIDLQKAAVLKLRASEIAKALETAFTEDRSEEFKKDGVSYEIHVESLLNTQYIDEIYIPNDEGALIALSTVVQLIPTALPEQLNHYNQKRSGTLSFDLKEGRTVGQAVDYLNKKLPELMDANFSYEFEGAARELQRSSRTLTMLFLLSLIFIYAVLAVQFESFVDPFIIMLTVPLACSGSLIAMWITDQSLNIFTQIGLITLVGLITKNGILIVDFANRLYAEGSNAIMAVRQAAIIRLRPILMTTLATAIGHSPLIFATGAGAPSRKAIGITLVIGLLFGTILTLFVIPTMYWVVKQLRERGVAWFRARY